MRNWSSGFPTRSDTNRALLPQKMARDLKFRILVVEEMYYLCSENKGACYRTAQLVCAFVFAFAKSRFSHDAAHMFQADVKRRTIIPSGRVFL